LEKEEWKYERRVYKEESGEKEGKSVKKSEQECVDGENALGRGK